MLRLEFIQRMNREWATTSSFLSSFWQTGNVHTLETILTAEYCLFPLIKTTRRNSKI